MSAPAVLHKRSILYESNPSVLTVATKCRDARDPNGNPRPLDVVYLPLRSSRASGSSHETTAEEVGQVRGKGRTPGLWAQPTWMPPGTSAWTNLLGHRLVDPIVFRKTVTQELVDLYAIGDPVILNHEKIPVEWWMLFLLGRTEATGTLTQGWRGRGGVDNNSGSNPWRPTGWTDASFQIGNYSAELLALLDKFGFAFFCEMFYGGMGPVEEREDAIRELRDAGFPGIDALPMYDADKDAQPGPNSWRKGCLFTTNRWDYFVT